MLIPTVYNYAKFATYKVNGCLDQVAFCLSTNLSSLADYAICTEAENMCRDNVEGPYYDYGGRGTVSHIAHLLNIVWYCFQYDIRHPQQDPTPPEYFTDYLNLPSVQNALGVSLNYTESNNDVYYAFQQTGDFVFPNFLKDLEMLLNNNVRVHLYYGDADYICNWYSYPFQMSINYIG